MGKSRNKQQLSTGQKLTILALLFGVALFMYVTIIYKIVYFGA
jgi:hypothetical protein